MAIGIKGAWEEYYGEDPFDAGGLEFDPRLDKEEQAAVRRYRQGIGDKNDFEIYRNYVIRITNDGYSVNSVSNQYTLEDELKEQGRLSQEGVSLENSPVGYLEQRYYFLDQVKCYQLEYELRKGIISQREYRVELEVVIAEMDSIERIIAERVAYTEQAGSIFLSIGTVIDFEFNSRVSYSTQITNLRSLLELFCRRQVGIDRYNSFKKTLEDAIKSNGELN
jgi:hypothetical protein